MTPEARKAQFHRLIDTAEYFDSDVTKIVGRNDQGELLFVAVFARGESAAPLEEFLGKE